MLGHDHASTYFAAGETKITPDSARALSPLWEVDVRANTNGTPAVVGDRVYVVSRRGVFAFDAASGDQIWNNPDVPGSSSAAYANDTLYVSAAPATVYALDPADGAERWTAKIDPHPNASATSSPIPVDDLVVIGSSSGEEGVKTEGATFRGAVVAFDAASGAERWRTYTVEPPFNGATVWSTVSVDLDERRVYATTGNNYTEQAGDTSDSIFALDLDDGHVVWKTQLKEGDVFTILNPQGNPDHDFGANPILYEAEVGGEMRKMLAAGQKSGQMWGLDRETGDVLWEQALGTGNVLSGGILNNGAYDGEQLYFMSNQATSDAPGGEPERGTGRTGVLAALDPATGEIIWERQLGEWNWNPITVANGVGFVASWAKMEAFDTATGARLWDTDAAGTITSGAAMSEGRIFFGSGMSYIVGDADTKVRAFAVP